MITPSQVCLHEALVASRPTPDEAGPVRVEVTVALNDESEPGRTDGRMMRPWAPQLLINDGHRPNVSNSGVMMAGDFASSSRVPVQPRREVEQPCPRWLETAR